MQREREREREKKLKLKRKKEFLVSNTLLKVKAYFTNIYMKQKEE